MKQRKKQKTRTQRDITIGTEEDVDPDDARDEDTEGENVSAGATTFAKEEAEPEPLKEANDEDAVADNTEEGEDEQAHRLKPLEADDEDTVYDKEDGEEDDEGRAPEGEPTENKPERRQKYKVKSHSKAMIERSCFMTLALSPLPPAPENYSRRLKIKQPQRARRMAGKEQAMGTAMRSRRRGRRRG